MHILSIGVLCFSNGMKISRFCDVLFYLFIFFTQRRRATEGTVKNKFAYFESSRCAEYVRFVQTRWGVVIVNLRGCQRVCVRAPVCLLGEATVRSFCISV